MPTISCDAPVPLRRTLAGALRRCLMLVTVVGASQAAAQSSASPPQAPSAGDEAVRAVIDRVAGAAVQERGIPHLIVAVSRHGRRSYYAYGADPGDAFARDTIVEIGSITKVFTTALYAEAIRQGVMRPDASLATYLPGEVQVPQCTAAITVQDLADFRSGMPLLPDDAPRRLADRSIDEYGVRAFYAWLSNWSPPAAGSPGTGSVRDQCGLPAPYAYSNASVGLLGLLVANAYRAPWDRLVADRITGPLGAVDTGISPDASQQARVARGHSPRGEPVIPWPEFAWFAAGALRSTAQDMLGFGEAALGHPVVDGHPVPAALTGAFADAMTPVYRPDGKPFRQATGWALEPVVEGDGGGAWLAFKDGGTDGFNSMIVVDRAHDTVVFAVADMSKSRIPELGLEIARGLAAN